MASDEYSVICPTCGSEHNYDELEGFELDPNYPGNNYEHWVGPSFCPTCGQSLDLSWLNTPSKSKEKIKEELFNFKYKEEN